VVDCRIVLLSGTRRVHMHWRSTLHGKAAIGPMRARDEKRSNTLDFYNDHAGNFVGTI